MVARAADTRIWEGTESKLKSSPIPVIDLFAGPGGLGEGFSSVRDDRDNHVFRIALSVEMDERAHQTLELRAFHRQFDDLNRPDEYYAYLEDPTPEARSTLFASHPREAAAAQGEAWRLELTADTASAVSTRAKAALQGRKMWVLIGGPPCQAYSLAGRSRRTHDKGFSSDKKHTLYEHYLRLINDLEPPVFVMENVKGMLSSRLGEKSTISKILEDLRRAGPGYDIYSFVRPIADPATLNPSDFVIKSEEHGIPQRRHRVILLGIRKPTLGRKTCRPPQTLVKRGGLITVRSVIDDLPRLRSRISPRKGTQPDSIESWLSVLAGGLVTMDDTDSKTRRTAKQAVATARRSTPPAQVAPGSSRGSRASEIPWAHWYLRDLRAPRNLNHDSRSHMASDIERYLFCASFAQAWSLSPRLNDFPARLLPAHANVLRGVTESHFADRFRVQGANEPSTTITSHISKDGHYYIHHDPSQCRSLSVREAARLQTFPDDYFFEGNRTQQYHQVGNAVPPLLAVQLAEVVAGVFGESVRPTLPPGP